MSRSLYCLIEKAEYDKEKDTTTYKLLSDDCIGSKHSLLTLRDFFNDCEEFIEGLDPDSTPFYNGVPKNISKGATEQLGDCDTPWYINLDTLEYLINDFFFYKLPTYIKYEMDKNKNGEDYDSPYTKRCLNNSIRMFNDLNCIAYNASNINDEYCNEDMLRLIFYIC